MAVEWSVGMDARMRDDAELLCNQEHFPRYLIYQTGYDEALMDVHTWFNTPGAGKFCKDLRIPQKLICQLLRLFLANKSRFQRNAWDFQIVAKQIMLAGRKTEWELSAPFKEVVILEENAKNETNINA